METLTLNKFAKYVDSPIGYWNDCLENRRELTPDEQQQYQNICEVYSDLYTMFMTKKSFTVMELESLWMQYNYFKKVSQCFKTDNMRCSLPKWITKEIEVMERNLERYFAQFKGGYDA